MQVILTMLAVLVFLAAWAVSEAVRLLSGHAVTAAIAGAAAIAAVSYAAWAIVRGLLKHTVLSWRDGNAARERRLPAAARPLALEAVPFGPPGPGEDDGVTLFCERAGCLSALDDRPWTVEARLPQGSAEEHSFCSQACAEQWAASAEAAV